MNSEVSGEIVDTNQPHVVHRLHSRRAELIAGVVPLHVANHRRHASPLDGVDDAFGFGQGEPERFLDEEMFTRLGRRHGHLGVLHRQDSDGVNVFPAHQIGEVREASGHPEPLADRLHQHRRQIADRRHPKLRQFRQVWQMHDLGDLAAPDHAHPQRLHDFSVSR